MVEIDIKCPICLELPVIPVQVLCFPCDCMGGQRLCLSCARSWLHLHYRQSIRNHVEQKCLYCDSKLSHNMREHDLIQIDMLLLQNRLNEKVICPCGYSDKYNIIHHIREICPLTNEQCIHCFEDVPRLEITSKQHVLYCNAYEKCPINGCCYYWKSNYKNPTVISHLQNHIDHIQNQIKELKQVSSECRRHIRQLEKK